MAATSAAAGMPTASTSAASTGVTAATAAMSLRKRSSRASED
jgi:hypothetical protein